MALGVLGKTTMGMIRGGQMVYLRGLIGLFVLVILGVPASHADTHVVDLYDVPIAVSPFISFSGVNLNAEITGISNVSVRVEGVGGGGNFDCNGAVPDGYYDMDVRLTFASGRFEFSTSNLLDFDVIASEIDFDPDPYAVCEGVTQCVLTATCFAQGTQYTDCTATDFTLPVISHVEVTITADSVVPTSDVSWGTVKAIYSGKH